MPSSVRVLRVRVASPVVPKGVRENASVAAVHLEASVTVDVIGFAVHDVPDALKGAVSYTHLTLPTILLV